MADSLVIRGAREHNLRNVDLELPRDKLIVFTGLSGSGKSSLAFDTIYAEGQRRYVESLSAYARQFLGQMDKPDVDFIEGLSPAISIDQKSASPQPALDGRHHHRGLRLPAPAVRPHRRAALPRRAAPTVTRQTPQQIVDRILELPEGTRFQVLAPVVRGRKGNYETLLADLAAQGFARARVDGELHELTDKVELARYEQHTIEVVVDRLVRRDGHRAPAHRLARDRAAAGRGRGRGPDRRRATARSRASPRRSPSASTWPARRAARQLRRAGAPQLLVQLALRRLRALRRPRHPLRGRPRAGRARPRPRRSTRAPSRRGPAAAAQYFHACSRRSAEEHGIRHRHAVAAS